MRLQYKFTCIQNRLELKYLFIDKPKTPKSVVTIQNWSGNKTQVKHTQKGQRTQHRQTTSTREKHVQTKPGNKESRKRRHIPSRSWDHDSFLWSVQTMLYLQDRPGNWLVVPHQRSFIHINPNKLPEGVKGGFRFRRKSWAGLVIQSVMIKRLGDALCQRVRVCRLVHAHVHMGWMKMP